MGRRVIAFALPFLAGPLGFGLAEAADRIGVMPFTGAWWLMITVPVTLLAVALVPFQQRLLAPRARRRWR
jgi:hypothetical protein